MIVLYDCLNVLATLGIWFALLLAMIGIVLLTMVTGILHTLHSYRMVLICMCIGAFGYTRHMCVHMPAFIVPAMFYAVVKLNVFSRAVIIIVGWLLTCKLFYCMFDMGCRNLQEH